MYTQYEAWNSFFFSCSLYSWTQNSISHLREGAGLVVRFYIFSSTLTLCIYTLKWFSPTPAFMRNDQCPTELSVMEMNGYWTLKCDAEKLTLSFKYPHKASGCCAGKREPQGVKVKLTLSSDTTRLWFALMHSSEAQKVYIQLQSFMNIVDRLPGSNSSSSIC